MLDCLPSADPNARTIVSFHVLIDPECVDVGSGDRVAVHGSLAELGAWGVHGVPMTMDPNNPFIWNAQVEIPFAANENTPRGVFEFKYVVNCMCVCISSCCDVADLRLRTATMYTWRVE